jgi:S-disulfanyl-L-cysteine oxidoreductase SoxD
MRGVLIAVGLIVPLTLAARAPREHVAARTVWDSVYTPAQAARGESTYAKTCARCHGASLSGGDESPPLAGGAFLGNWNGLPLSDLQDRIQKTMPSDSVGIYDRKLVTDVMAHLLKANGFPAGVTELPVPLDSLKEIVIRTSRP